MEGRALWDVGQFAASATPTASIKAAYCTSFTLPSGGVITLDSFSVVTLAADAIFHPLCADTVDVSIADLSSGNDLRDPFYASTLPQCYALAATTVIAYMLVIMLFITPRTFLSGGVLVLGRRGFTNGPSGSAQGIGIGGRPWLQKVAALTVAISLTIATTNTFRVAEYQYNIGYMDAVALQNDVLDSMELKIIRVISDTFLWLAQAQTLIRLFPRQREKVIIKWTAFALISLNLIFSILNTFVYPTNGLSKPYSISAPIPAVSYLFHLALGLLYGAWVVYYGFTKRNYAFYHRRMRNICLVALMSVTAVIVPVVFFVLDISKPNVAGWGDYVRWVGAAASSVVVWEWVERIEALERHDKKDGILGREVFDGDEMLEVTPSSDNYLGRRHLSGGGSGNRGGSSTSAAGGSSWPTINRHRLHTPEPKEGRDAHTSNEDCETVSHRHIEHQLPRWPNRPPPTATPVSRTDTASAESTVYAVRYHPASELRGPEHDTILPQQSPRLGSFDIEAQHHARSGDTNEVEKESLYQNIRNGTLEPSRQHSNAWEAIQRYNPFYRKALQPLRDGSLQTEKRSKSSRNGNSSNRWEVLGRLEDFAAFQAERMREKARPAHESVALTVTRIPAPPRRRTLQEIMEELDHEDPRQVSRNQARVSAVVLGDATARRVLQSDTPLDSSERSHGPLAPTDVENAGTTSRANISFASPAQIDRDREPGAASNGDTPDRVDVDNGLSTQSSSHRTPGSLFQTRTMELSRPPVLRIPAPPRQTQSES